MKVVIQRVKNSSVSVDGNLVSEINKGLNILVGIGVDDTQVLFFLFLSLLYRLIQKKEIVQVTLMQ